MRQISFESSLGHKSKVAPNVQQIKERAMVLGYRGAPRAFPEEELLGLAREGWCARHCSRDQHSVTGDGIARKPRCTTGRVWLPSHQNNQLFLYLRNTCRVQGTVLGAGKHIQASSLFTPDAEAKRS